MYPKNKKMHMNRIMIAFFVLLIVFVIAFIFSNSLKSSKTSLLQSKPIAEMLQKIFDSNMSIKKEVFHKIVRKFAHVFEYMLLGTGIGGVFLYVYVVSGKRYISLPILIGISIGICDEFIQSFTSRKSMVGDVLIDFVGVLIGFLIVNLIYIVINKILNKRQNKNN